MKNSFAPESRFMEFCGRLAELAGINLLFLLCSLPIFTAGASCCAMYSCIFRHRRGEKAGPGPFLAAFRSCFLRATGIWLVTLLLAGALGADYWIVANLQFPGRMAVIGLIFFVGFALLLFAAVVFPLLSQFPDTLKNTVVNALLLSIANLPKVLLVTAVNLLPLALLLALPRVFAFLGGFWLLWGFSLTGCYGAMVLERIFAPFRKPDGAVLENGGNPHD